MFKWVNPGYGDLLENQGTTKYSTDLNPTNGVAFVSGSSRVIAFPSGTKEVWIKCHVKRGHVSGIISVSGTGYPTGLMLNNKKGDGYISLWFNEGSGGGVGYYTQYFDWATLDIVLHIKSHSVDGLIETWINGDYVGIRQGNCYKGNDLPGLWLSSENNDNYFSNIIVADYDISREEVIEAKLQDPIGDWKGLEIGQAEATAVGQTITQKIDTDDLKTRIEAKSETIDISSVSLAAVGVKFDSTAVNALTGAISSGGTDDYTRTKKIINNGAANIGTYIKDYTLDKLKDTDFKLVAAKA